MYYGGEVAAPAFSRVASEVLAYWQISQNQVPDEVVKSGAKFKKVQTRPVTAPALAVQTL